MKTHSILAAGTLVLAGILAVQAEAQTATPESNWTTQCAAKDRNSRLFCSMEQRVVDAGSGQQIASIVIRTRQGDLAGTTYVIQLPLGLSIAAGVTLGVDTIPPVKLGIQTCEATGCFVGGTLDDKLLDALKKGNELVIGIRNLQDNQISLPFSLGGFSAAYEAIR